MTDNSQHVIRLARQEAMIQELACFEEASDSCHATVESLTKSLTFEPSDTTPNPTPGFAKTFLATIPASTSTSGKEEIAGMGLFFYNYSTWKASPGVYLEDLFVRPQYRRQGIATILLRRLAKEAYDVSGGVGRLEWNCLKWNENALKFYAEVGGERQDEWVGIRVDGERLRKLAGLE
ncbi:hypothetical protein FH972_021402 [Carpinus fangiana]|uniref:N-acetyltransferase domain-containing protein n=1 Tax=Carpinus fangiana TaxID=176857 RepID=A0A5N6KP87_9ROSI|nr:hypothetical protein FH972_021402 [Carpinus fangiana]